VLKKDVIHALIAMGEVQDLLRARELYSRLIEQKILTIMPAKETMSKPQLPYLNAEDEYFQDSLDHDMSKENGDYEWDEDFSPPVYKPTGKHHHYRISYLVLSSLCPYSFSHTCIKSFYYLYTIVIYISEYYYHHHPNAHIHTLHNFDACMHRYYSSYYDILFIFKIKFAKTAFDKIIASLLSSSSSSSLSSSQSLL
jgi:hypothetical protein